MRTVQITVMSTSIVRVRAVVDMCALLGGGCRLRIVGIGVHSRMMVEMARLMHAEVLSLLHG